MEEIIDENITQYGITSYSDIYFNSTGILVLSIVMQIGLSENVCNIVEIHSNICK